MNRLLLVGHGRMGQIVESLAPDLRLRAGRHRHRARCPTPSRRDYGQVDVAIDFTVPEAVPVNLPQLAARGINVVIGTTGWLAHEAGAQGRSRARRDWRGRLGQLLPRHEPVHAARRGCRPALRRARRRRRLDPRAASRGQEGRAVGHGADAAAGDGRAPATPATSTWPRPAPDRFPARTPSASTAPRRPSRSPTRCATAACSPAARSRRRAGWSAGAAGSRCAMS